MLLRKFSPRSSNLRFSSMACCLALIFVVLLAGCTRSPVGHVIRDRVGTNSTRHSFNVCHGYGCTSITNVSISDNEWVKVRTLFVRRPQNAEEERKRISLAIALLERIVGPKAGIEGDIGGATYFGKTGQLDCVDEAANTTSYLSFLRNDGLMTYHDIGEPVIYGNMLVNNWPSNSATIIERGTSNQYAVDSFWHNNGSEPEILPVYLWSSGCWLDTPECRRLSYSEAIECCAGG